MSKKAKPREGEGQPINWEALKSEFLAGNDSLASLQRKYKIGRGWFDQKTKGWTEERRRIRGESVEEARVQLRDSYKQYAEDTKEALQTSIDKVKEILRGRKDKDGNEIPVKTFDLLNIVNTLQSGLKTFRLIEGKSTENVAMQGGYSRDYYRAMLDFVSGKIPAIPVEFYNDMPQFKIEKCSKCGTLIARDTNPPKLSHG